MVRQQQHEDERRDGGPPRVRTEGAASESCGHIDEPLEPAVPGPVKLADIEHQGDPLQLGQRQLAQPLVVEERQRPDTDSGLVQHGGLAHDRLVVLRFPIEHDDTRGMADNGFDQRALAGLVGAGLGHAEVGDDGGVALGCLAELGSEGVGLLEADNGNHAVALFRPRPPTRGQHGAGHIPWHQDERGTEDDEPREEAGPDEQLDQ